MCSHSNLQMTTRAPVLVQLHALFRQLILHLHLITEVVVLIGLWANTTVSQQRHALVLLNYPPTPRDREVYRPV